ncbi:VOC family protein [Nocardia sp. CDC160]|uniref:VOC family protein n=1 Tax=Nocardia sp. CDC160 TaxID=3112166 RepID=UPI002DBE7712|nr:VOC family protein [Nocardia sp. CDC160]MEC3914829.1 VOC family protein [Nocardia sp. CDC160]
MACKITELVIDCADPARLADFWCEVLGYVEIERDAEDRLIGPPGSTFGGPHVTLLFSRNDDPRRGKLPMHIDVNATDRDQDAELERLLAAGARPVDIGQTGNETWHVLADPEGNEFCLLRRRVAPNEAT